MNNDQISSYKKKIVMDERWTCTVYAKPKVKSQWEASEGLCCNSQCKH